MRKKKNFYTKNKKYIWLWVFIIITLGIFSIKSISLPIRGTFQEVSVEIGKIFKPKKVILEEYDKNLIESLRKENEDLRNLLNYKESLANYNIIPASIIYRNNILENTIIIDCGKKEGTKKDNIVVTEKGLIGKVVEVYGHSSLVQLLTDTKTSNKVAVSIFSNEKEFYGVLEGYDLSEKEFKITITENTNEIELGSQVLTNGLGGIYPNGIFVGTVSKITKDELGISIVLKVKSKVDFMKIGYVFVLGK